MRKQLRQRPTKIWRRLLVLLIAITTGIAAAVPAHSVQQTNKDRRSVELHITGWNGCVDSFYLMLQHKGETLRAGPSSCDERLVLRFKPRKSAKYQLVTRDGVVCAEPSGKWLRKQPRRVFLMCDLTGTGREQGSRAPETGGGENSSPGGMLGDQINVVYTIARGYGAGFNDILPGTQVEVFDGAGRLLGFGRLGDIFFPADCDCAMLQATFSIPRSSDGFYRVTAGNSNRGFLNFTQSDVVNGVLQVDSFLG